MSDKKDDEPLPMKVRPRKRPPQLSPGAAQLPPADDDGAAETSTPNNDYRVGYKCPPRHSQFQPGQSGNRKGRPKGSRNWTTIVDEAASRRRTVGVGGRKVRMCGRAAIAEQMVVSAIKGDRAARKDFLNEMTKLGQSHEPRGDDKPQESLSECDAALLAEFFQRTAKLRDDEP